MTNSFQPVDLARLAAYIDGEGHISICKSGPSRAYKMQVTITNTDVRLVLWLKDTFGGGHRAKGLTHSKRRVWYWYAGSTLANELLTQCLPYFIMKRDQAEIAIAYYRTVRKVTGCKVVSDAHNIEREFLAAQLKQAREDAAPVIN